MPNELEYLIEQARKYEMSASERDEQIKSFAYGNTHFENQTITRDNIADAAKSLKAEEPTDR